MNYFQEKITLSVSSIIATALASYAAVISTGAVQWFCITLAVSFITSVLLSLTFRQFGETMSLVASRCGISMLGGIFITKYLSLEFEINVIHTDLVAFAGLTSLITTVMFIFGYKVLRILERRSNYLASRFVDARLKALFPDTNDSNDGSEPGLNKNPERGNQDQPGN